jgi:polyhydroxyalkanoate synthesis regulator phasin
MAKDRDNAIYSPRLEWLSKEGAEKGSKYVDYLVAKGGLPVEKAAAIVGNLVQESSLNPTAWNEEEKALGLAQWRGERQQNLRNFVKDKKRKGEYELSRDIQEPEVQLDFIIHELKTTEKNAGDKFLKAKGLADSVKAFDHHYERSSKAHTHLREAYAKDLYDYYVHNSVKDFPDISYKLNEYSAPDEPDNTIPMSELLRQKVIENSSLDESDNLPLKELIMRDNLVERQDIINRIAPPDVPEVRPAIGEEVVVKGSSVTGDEKFPDFVHNLRLKAQLTGQSLKANDYLQALNNGNSPISVDNTASGKVDNSVIATLNSALKGKVDKVNREVTRMTLNSQGDPVANVIAKKLGVSEWDKKITPLKNQHRSSLANKYVSVLADNIANSFLASMGNQAAVQKMANNDKMVAGILSTMTKLAGITPDSPFYQSMVKGAEESKNIANIDKALGDLATIGMTSREWEEQMANVKGDGYVKQAMLQSLPQIYTILANQQQAIQESYDSQIGSLPAEDIKNRNDLVSERNKRIGDIQDSINDISKIMFDAAGINQDTPGKTDPQTTNNYVYETFNGGA